MAPAGPQARNPPRPCARADIRGGACWASKRHLHQEDPNPARDVWRVACSSFPTGDVLRRPEPRLSDDRRSLRRGTHPTPRWDCMRAIPQRRRLVVALAGPQSRLLGYGRHQGGPAGRRGDQRRRCTSESPPLEEAPRAAPRPTGPACTADDAGGGPPTCEKGSVMESPSVEIPRAALRPGEPCMRSHETGLLVSTDGTASSVRRRADVPACLAD